MWSVSKLVCSLLISSSYLTVFFRSSEKVLKHSAISVLHRLFWCILNPELLYLKFLMKQYCLRSGADAKRVILCASFISLGLYWLAQCGHFKAIRLVESHLKHLKIFPSWSTGFVLLFHFCQSHLPFLFYTFLFPFFFCHLAELSLLTPKNALLLVNGPHFCFLHFHQITKYPDYSVLHVCIVIALLKLIYPMSGFLHSC